MKIFWDYEVKDEIGAMLTQERIIFELSKSFELKAMGDATEINVFITGWKKK